MGVEGQRERKSNVPRKSETDSATLGNGAIKIDRTGQSPGERRREKKKTGCTGNYVNG